MNSGNDAPSPNVSAFPFPLVLPFQGRDDTREGDAVLGGRSFDFVPHSPPVSRGRELLKGPESASRWPGVPRPSRGPAQRRAPGPPAPASPGTVQPTEASGPFHWRRCFQLQQADFAAHPWGP